LIRTEPNLNHCIPYETEMKIVNNHILISFVFLIILSCNSENSKISEKEFYTLMENIAVGWSTQNTELALNSFSKNAIYMQPPNVQFYQGHTQLKPYFDELTDKHKMKFHNLWFDGKKQTGVGEFTFSYGKDTSDIGIVVVEIKGGKISHWREYLTKGDTDFDEFLSIENKKWDWHIGNYPEPKDSTKQK